MNEKREQIWTTETQRKLIAAVGCGTQKAARAAIAKAEQQAKAEG